MKDPACRRRRFIHPSRSFGSNNCISRKGFGNQTIVEASKKSGKKGQGQPCGFVAETTTDLEIKDEAKSLATGKEGAKAFPWHTSFRLRAKAEAGVNANERQSCPLTQKSPGSSFTKLQAFPEKIQALVLDGLGKKTLFQFPLQPKRTSLGRSRNYSIRRKTSVIRRIGEIRQGKRFLLTPGQFELRMTDQLGSVVILSGELKRRSEFKDIDSKETESSSNGSRDGDYEFVAKEAWWLDQNEVRQALPVNELAP